MENEQTVVDTTEMAGQEPNASVGKSAMDKTEGANAEVPAVGKETAAETEKTVEEESGTDGEPAAEKQDEKKPEETRAEDAADPRYAEAELKAACAIAGIPKERIAFAMRALDKSAVKNAEDAEKQVNELLQIMPMFAEQANGTGSTGAFARKQESESEATRRNFAAGL